jgi:hypothetical protein
MPNNGYSVVPVQKAFTALRIIQVILGIIILGLSAYPVSLTSGYGYGAYIFEPGAIGIFTGIATLIFVVYWFVSNSVSNQKLYNYWAIFAVECFVWVFWLTTFALYASFVGQSLSTMGNYNTSYSGGNTYCYSGYCVTGKRGLSKRYVQTDPVAGTIYAALAFSVINFILFSVTLILFTVNMMRHRTAHASVHHGQTDGAPHASVRRGQTGGGSHAMELKA